MATVSELFNADVLPALQLAGLANGRMDLDHLTYGLLPGALWVIAATPGAGRTTLACQVACHAATTGGSVAVVSGRGECAEVLTNLLASQAEVAAARIHRGVFSAAESQRLAVATARLAELDLRLYSPADDVWAYPDGEGVAAFSSLVSSGRRVADLLVVDDLDLSLEGKWLHALPALQAWARTGAFTLVVTVPAEDVAAEEPCHPDLRRHADIVVRLRLAGQFDPSDARAGQADLDALRNRHGPQARVTVQFQGHYRRFTDA